MQRLELLLDDHKAKDILKMGFDMGTVTDLAMEITDVDCHDDLNPEFCYRLHKKYGVSLEAIKVLVSRAIFYLKNEEHLHSLPTNYHPVRRIEKTKDANISGASAKTPQKMDVIILTSSSESEDGPASIRETRKKACSVDEEQEKMECEDEEKSASDWEVEDILDHFVNKDGVKSYRVQWKTDREVESWSEDENWVNESDMHCPEMIERYEAKLRRDSRQKQLVLSKKALQAKRVREMREKIRLQIADDKDICTSSDESNIGPVKRKKVNYKKKIKKPETKEREWYDVSSDTISSSAERSPTKKDAINKASTSNTHGSASRPVRIKRIPKRVQSSIYVSPAKEVNSSRFSREFPIIVSDEELNFCEELASPHKDSFTMINQSMQPSTSKCHRRPAHDVRKRIPASHLLEQNRKRVSHPEDETKTQSFPKIFSSDEEPNNYETPISPFTDSVATSLHKMTVHPGPICAKDEAGPSKAKVSDEVLSKWTKEWYAQAESGETRALERNLEPHQCLLYQKSTDARQFGRCLFVFMVDGELKGDFIYFPLTGQHAARMRELLNSFMGQVKEMGLSYEVLIQRNKEEFEKERRLRHPKEEF